MPLSKPLWRVFKFKHKQPQPEFEFGRDFLLESKANGGLSSLPLPPEVWAEIFSYVTRVEERAMIRICLVCRAFYWEGVRLLYRRVTFVSYPLWEIWLKMQRWFVTITTRPRLAALVQALKIPFADWSIHTQDKSYKRSLDTIGRGFELLPNLKE